MKIPASKGPVLIGLIAATAGFAALTAVVKGGPRVAPGPLHPEPQISKPGIVEHHDTAPILKPELPRDPAPVVTDQAVVRYVAMDGETPKLSKELTLHPGEDPHARSLAATVKSLGYSDVRILKVNVESEAAMVDVSPALTSEGFSSTSEAALLEAMARTLGQFSEIKTFQLRIDGQIVDTLGHLELSEPTKVIRPGDRSEDRADDSASSSRETTP